MTVPGSIAVAEREALLRFDTGKVANAIEHLGIRLKNEGFTRPGLRWWCGPSRVLGFAVTSKVRCADPPMKGAAGAYDLGDWWRNIEQHPSPRIAIIEDLDDPPGAGAVLSDLHAQVLMRLECPAAVTNGAVRNIDGLARIGFTALQVSGVSLHPGELVYADANGLIAVPADRLSELVSILEERAAGEATVAELCQRRAPLEEILEATRRL